MSAAWDVSDFYLAQMLGAFLSNFVAEVFTVCLYKNDYTPVPGATLADFEEADFAGYGSIVFNMSDFDTVTVTTHVASSVQTVQGVFTGSAGSWTPQTIHGYFAFDWTHEYFFAERFNVPVDMSPDGELKITPRLKHAVLPA